MAVKSRHVCCWLETSLPLSAHADDDEFHLGIMFDGWRLATLLRVYW